MPEENNQEQFDPRGFFPVIPRHAHTGVDSPLIEFKNLDGIRDTRVTYNPGNITSGSAEITTFTFTGARLGDFILASAPYDLQGIQVSGYVQSKDTVALVLQNAGTAAVNLASGAWIIKKITA